MEKWDLCNFAVNEEELKGRVCYGGLDAPILVDFCTLIENVARSAILAHLIQMC